MNPFTVLVPGKKGCYIVVVPNFELMRVDQTNEIVKANTLTPFGFPFEHHYSESHLDNQNLSVSETHMKKNVFRTSYEKLQGKLIEIGADYVLIDGFHCSPGPNSTCHATIHQCQFLVSIAHKHIPPPVFG